jgi:hypothetical protein
MADAIVETRNIRADPGTLTIRKAFYVPDVQRIIINCNALLNDNYQIILPSPCAENMLPAGIHNCHMTLIVFK